jgi:autophagy-related protein 16
MAQKASNIIQEAMISSPRRSWRKSILCQLRNRNQMEITPFQDLIQVHNRIVERISSLQMENTQMAFINERLKSDLNHLKISTGDNILNYQGDSIANRSGQATSSEDTVTKSTIAMLEKKLFAIQEELTEMHRRKGMGSDQTNDSINTPSPLI